MTGQTRQGAFLALDMHQYFVYTLGSMKTAVLNIKIDPKVKREAHRVADELGFSLSAIVNASLKNLARTKTVSYSLLEPTPLLQRAIRSARANRLKGKSIGPFSTVPEMMRSLRS